MKVLGIIAEYNPFHKGHQYHLEQARKESGADCSVAVMSGNFLQRGEPAMWDKSLRAEAAVRNGVDLVLELPFVFACNNAEEFAYGGISILNGLGCVTDLAFGCEGQADRLIKTANRLAVESDTFRNALSAALSKGISYASARGEALSSCGLEGEAELLSKPNNILAVEYLKQCILTGSAMRPHGIRRMDAGYHSRELPPVATGEKDAEGRLSLASATAIRQELMRTSSYESVSGYIPEGTLAALSKVSSEEWIDLEDFYLPIAMRIRSASEEELSQIWAVTEGMERLLKKAVIRANSMESLIESLKTKRYARTRLQRTLIQTVMGLTRQDYGQIRTQGICYAHILAFSSKGAELLRHIRRAGCAAIPVYSNLSKEIRDGDREQLALKYDLLASDLYHLAQGKDIYGASDLVRSPYRG